MSTGMAGRMSQATNVPALSTCNVWLKLLDRDHAAPGHSQFSGG